MKQYALEENLQGTWLEPGLPMEDYYSVEFSIHGLDYLYQFKIWKMTNDSMCVLVKKDSELLGRIKVGDVIRMKYYTTDALCPTRDLDTEIKYINADDEGRFKGHCLVGISVLGNGNRNSIH